MQPAKRQGRAVRSRGGVTPPPGLPNQAHSTHPLWPGYSMPLPPHQPHHPHHPHVMECWSTPYALGDYQPHAPPVSLRTGTGLPVDYAQSGVSSMKPGSGFAVDALGPLGPVGRQGFGFEGPLGCKKVPGLKIEALNGGGGRFRGGRQKSPGGDETENREAEANKDRIEHGHGGHKEFSDDEGEGKEKRQPCQFFLRTGTCAFGGRCKFHHPKNHSPPELNSLNYPLRPNEKSCAFYLKTGWCAFGATCKFHHPPPPANQAPPVKVPQGRASADPRMNPLAYGAMGVMPANWPTVPNLWYPPALPSGQMMPLRGPIQGPMGGMSNGGGPHGLAKPSRAYRNENNKSLMNNTSGRSSRTSFDEHRSGEGGSSGSSDETRAEVEEGYANEAYWRSKHDRSISY